MGSNIDYSYLNDPIERAVERKLAEKGGSGYNGGMDTNGRLDRIEQDIRHVWMAYIGGVVVLAGLMVGVYVRLDDKVSLVQKDVNDLKVSMATVIQKLDDLKPHK